MVLNMANVIGYVRVSTDEQATNGASLAAQQAQIEAYCVTYGLTLVAVVEDAGLSASTLDRPGLQRCLAELESVQRAHSPRSSKSAPTGLVVTKLDRLTRSVRDLSALLESGAGTTWALHSVNERLDTGTATGRMMLNVLMTVSQWEREVIGERTSATLRHLQANGQHLGAVPFGYRLDRESGRLVAVEAEQSILSRVRSRRAEGATLETIAAELDADGIKGTRGGKWTAMSVRRALLRANR